MEEKGRRGGDKEEKKENEKERKSFSILQKYLILFRKITKYHYFHFRGPKKWVLQNK